MQLAVSGATWSLQALKSLHCLAFASGHCLMVNLLRRWRGLQRWRWSEHLWAAPLCWVAGQQRRYFDWEATKEPI